MRKFVAVTALALVGCLGLAPIPTGYEEMVELADGCSDELWARTYFGPQRLETIAPCVRVQGIVRSSVPSDDDGDHIILLEVDARLINEANRRSRQGLLVVEVVCRWPGRFSRQSHRESCAGYQGPFPWLPPVGARVLVLGRYVRDRDHGGHMEIHPATQIQVAASP